MSKRLVIKDANFAENSIIVEVPTWYFNYTDQQLGTSGSITSSNVFYMLPSEITEYNLTNKVVQYVKMDCPAAGTITIYSVNTSGSGSTTGSHQYSVKSGINVIKLATPITLTGAVSIGFSGHGIVPLNSSAGSGWGIGRTGTSTTYTQKLPIDLGYFDNS